MEDLINCALKYAQVPVQKGLSTGKTQLVFATHIPWIIAYAFQCGRKGMKPITRATFANDLMYDRVCSLVSILLHSFPNQFELLATITKKQEDSKSNCKADVLVH